MHQVCEEIELKIEFKTHSRLLSTICYAFGETCNVNVFKQGLTFFLNKRFSEHFVIQFDHFNSHKLKLHM